MLIAKELYKTYKKCMENHVIKGVSLSIEQGEYVVISGKSGSGKTTLLYLLSGLETPTLGEVLFNDISLKDLSDREISNIRRTKFGFVFQFYNLVQNLNVRNNIFLPVEFRKKDDGLKRDIIFDYINMLGLKDKLGAYPYQLSGGQQQRVAIARALAINPDIIFADEPTGNLDTATSKEVLDVFKTLNCDLKKTIILVTHDQSISKEHATREIFIEDGKIKNS